MHGSRRLRPAAAHAHGSSFSVRVAMMLQCTVLDRTRGKTMSGRQWILPTRSLGGGGGRWRARAAAVRVDYVLTMVGVTLTVLWPPNSIKKLRCEVLVLVLSSNPDKRWQINVHKDLPWRLGFQSFRAKFNLLRAIFIGVFAPNHCPRGLLPNLTGIYL
jgi:hypothetical protein